MFRIESGVVELALGDIRPTQLTVEYREVDAKRAAWNGLGKSARRKAMAELLFPVVKGPEGEHYLIDHHHEAARADPREAGQRAGRPRRRRLEARA